ncbi:hypothetical protein [Pseudoalteromonas shioyasakiensis]|uniref:hypothetical protein n=1 Tax=Pseudoalteromonas shioyasakiensis TaxID=1190813 RepID=UPI0025520A53|nr:hypothetical protein [Pseudoalteromonas shioyasakiensis]MDK9684825.1 hypothetical protein [Pseudoalteromonas shioyasakiensis]
MNLKLYRLLIVIFLTSLNYAHAAVIPQAGAAPIVFDQNATEDNITYLMASSAQRPDTTSVQSFGNPKHAWLQSFDSSEYLQWNVEVAAPANYRVTMLLRTFSAAQSFKLEVVGGSAINFTINKAGWQREHIGVINVPAGQHTLKLTRTTNNGDIHLKSLELIEDAKYSAYQARVNNFKSDATSFSNYKYGLMFQYGGWGFPQSGQAKTLDKQAADFNVSNFVNMVKSTGAEYVIWSATWWTYEINAPISELDALLGHSNRTSSRDLIGDIANALDAEGIGFYLYYHTGQDSHLGYNSTDWWVLNNWPSSFLSSGTGDRDTFFNNWKVVIKAMGERYGKKLDGWFFDDGLVYYPAPFEALGAAAKAGNPERLISYNPWIVAHYTDFEDLSFGEDCKVEGAPMGGTGLYTSTGDKGVYGHCMPRMENDWGIRGANQTIGNPNFTAKSAYNMVSERAERKVPTSFNLMMYEDGSVSQKSLDVLKGMKSLFGNDDEVGQKTINDDANITYNGGTWNKSRNRGAGDYNDDVSYTSVNGAYAEYSFFGTGVKLIGPRDPSQGNIEVFIDNISQGVINTSGSSYQAMTTYFEASNLSAANHTVKMVKLDGNWMQLDAITYTNPPVYINNTDNTITYAGTWRTSSNRNVKDYQDDVAYTPVNGDYFEYIFDGTGIEVISEMNSDQGEIEVQIDSQPAVILNTYNPSRLTQKTIYSQFNLSQGTHTLKVTKLSGQYMLLDALKVTR